MAEDRKQDTSHCLDRLQNGHSISAQMKSDNVAEARCPALNVWSAKAEGVE